MEVKFSKGSFFVEIDFVVFYGDALLDSNDKFVCKLVL